MTKANYAMWPEGKSRYGVHLLEPTDKCVVWFETRAGDVVPLLIFGTLTEGLDAVSRYQRARQDAIAIGARL